MARQLEHEARPLPGRGTAALAGRHDVRDGCVGALPAVRAVGQDDADGERRREGRRMASKLGGAFTAVRKLPTHRREGRPLSCVARKREYTFCSVRVAPVRALFGSTTMADRTPGPAGGAVTDHSVRAPEPHAGRTCGRTQQKAMSNHTQVF